MSRSVTIDGESYTLPTGSDRNWLADFNTLMLALIDVVNGLLGRGSILTFGASSAPVEVNDYYLFPGYEEAAAPTTARVVIIPAAGTLSRLYARLDAAAVTADVTFDVLVNGPPGGQLDAVVPAGQQSASNLADEIEVEAGDLVSVQISYGSEPALGASRIVCSLLFTPS